MFQTKVVRKSKYAFHMYNFFQKLCCLWDSVEKYCRAGQVTDDNVVCADCMLGT